MPEEKPDRRAWLLLLSAFIIALDRVTKAWVSVHIPEGSAIRVWDHVFRISHVLNPGAAFSMFVDSPRPELTRWLLAGFSILAAIVVLVILLRIGRRFTTASVALACILGGTIGNLWDRVRTGLVTDFLEVHIVHYHWPDFNLADSAIVVGGILLILDALFTPQHRDPPAA
jgi:signal peptidase II